MLLLQQHASLDEKQQERFWSKYRGFYSNVTDQRLLSAQHLLKSALPPAFLKKIIVRLLFLHIQDGEAIWQQETQSTSPTAFFEQKLLCGNQPHTDLKAEAFQFFKRPLFCIKLARQGTPAHKPWNSVAPGWRI